MWMQRAFTFIQVRINGGRREGCGVGGWGLGGGVGGNHELICINSKWLNRVEGRSSGGEPWPR